MRRGAASEQIRRKLRAKGMSKRTKAVLQGFSFHERDITISGEKKEESNYLVNEEILK